ncbi:MAG: hypothetical protein IPM16_10525 [Chloroflexi bacterium]|nr:hypothetical protein [Chloroflexota bacterium]
MYLRDDVFAVQDQAWGDGDIFAEYSCSPGVVVDRYKEGFRWKTLISLRATRHAGDHDVIRTRRVILNGFTTSVCNFQTQIDHPHRSLSIGVVFPSGRLPRSVSLVEQNTRRVVELSSVHEHLLPGGDVEYRWSTQKVKLFEAYIIRWEW